MTIQARRKEIVSRIYAILEKINSRKKMIDKEKLINEICIMYGCARRTALEYIKNAQYLFETQKKIKIAIDG